MSEQGAPPPRRGGMGGTLATRWGPLPVWGWAIVFVILVAMYLIYRRNKQQQQQQQQQQATAQNQAAGTYTPVADNIAPATVGTVGLTGDQTVQNTGTTQPGSTTSTPTAAATNNNSSTQGSNLTTGSTTPSAGLSGTGPTNTQPPAPSSTSGA